METQFFLRILTHTHIPFLVTKTLEKKIIGKMQSQTLRQAKIRFLCPHMIFPKFSQNLIFSDISSIYDEKEALEYISTMSQASLGLNPSFLDHSLSFFDVKTRCPHMILT